MKRRINFIFYYFISSVWSLSDKTILGQLQILATFERDLTRSSTCYISYHDSAKHKRIERCFLGLVTDRH
jgi:hypothetical protein